MSFHTPAHALVSVENVVKDCVIAQLSKNLGGSDIHWMLLLVLVLVLSFFIMVLIVHIGQVPETLGVLVSFCIIWA